MVGESDLALVQAPFKIARVQIDRKINVITRLQLDQAFTQNKVLAIFKAHAEHSITDQCLKYSNQITVNILCRHIDNTERSRPSELGETDKYVKKSNE